MFTLDTFVLIKCTYFIVWISDGHRGHGLRLLSLCFASGGRYNLDIQAIQWLGDQRFNQLTQTGNLVQDCRVSNAYEH